MVGEGERKGPKGTFGGKALPGMVFVEKKEEKREVAVEKKVVVVDPKKKEVMQIGKKKQETRVARGKSGALPCLSSTRLFAPNLNPFYSSPSLRRSSLPLLLHPPTSRCFHHLQHQHQTHLLLISHPLPRNPLHLRLRHHNDPPCPQVQRYLDLLRLRTPRSRASFEIEGDGVGELEGLGVEGEEGRRR